MKILLLSHGSLSKEIYQTVELIYGDTSALSYIIMEESQDMELYKNRIESYVKKSDGNILIIVDLLGGSPFITASSVYREYKDLINIEIVSGMNIPMLLEIVTSLNNGLAFTDMVNISLEAGVGGIKSFSNLLKGER